MPTDVHNVAGFQFVTDLTTLLLGENSFSLASFLFLERLAEKKDKNSNFVIVLYTVEFNAIIKTRRK